MASLSFTKDKEAFAIEDEDANAYFGLRWGGAGYIEGQCEVCRSSPVVTAGAFTVSPYPEAGAVVVLSQIYSVNSLQRDKWPLLDSS